MQIKTEILIDAPASAVWSILMDFERYPEWNPFIKKISGQSNAGEIIRCEISPPGGSPMTFKPTVLISEPAKEFRWIGKFLVKGLFDGEHYFILESVSPTQTRLIHGEDFRGVLVSLLKGVVAKAKEGFEMMNEALKARAEKSV